MKGDVVIACTCEESLASERALRQQKENFNKLRKFSGKKRSDYRKD